MAKLFTPNNSSTNIPTAEQNQAEFLSMQKQSQRMIDLQTQEMLHQKRVEQSGDIDIATQNSGDAAIKEQFGGLDNSTQNHAGALDLTNQNSSEKYTDSIPSIITNIVFIFLGILIISFLFRKRR